MSTQTKRFILVTGANKSIGYEIIKSLLLHSSTPTHIFLGSRNISNGEAAVASLREASSNGRNTVEAVQLDLGSDESIANAINKIKTVTGGRLDVLVNNAGVNSDIDFIREKCTLRESLTQAFDTNVAGTHVLTYSLIPLLLQSASPRLIFISGLGTFAKCATGNFPLPPDLQSGEKVWPKKTQFETVGYRCSKTALNMLMLDYHFKLRGDGVKVWCVGPGFLATDLGGAGDIVKAQGAGHPSEGGDFILKVVEGERDEYVGKYINKDGVVEF